MDVQISFLIYLLIHEKNVYLMKTKNILSGDIQLAVVLVLFIIMTSIIG
jgi:hypothetical protein